MNYTSRSSRYFLFALPGVAAGAIGLTLGAFLATENGWQSAIYYSAIGVICAPFATLAWATHSLRRRQVFAGVSLLGGFVTGMAMLLELTERYPAMLEAFAPSPFVFSAWLTLWVLWNAASLARLIWFTPDNTRKSFTGSPANRSLIGK